LSNVLAGCRDNLEVFQKNGFEFREVKGGRLALAAVPFRWVGGLELAGSARAAQIVARAAGRDLQPTGRWA
jgi:hypothetical protein